VTHQSKIFQLDITTARADEMWIKVRDNLSSGNFIAALLFMGNVRQWRFKYGLYLADQYITKMPGIYVALVPVLRSECRRHPAQFELRQKDISQTSPFLRSSRIEIKIPDIVIQPMVCGIQRAIDSVSG
jgi:hypothetical protein